MTTPSLPPVPGTTDSTDKLLIILSHLSLMLGVGFLLPLIVYLVKREESELVAAHAKEALNFHISLLIYAFCCGMLMFLCLAFIAIPLLILLGAASVILAIIAAIRASEGGFFRYPLTIRFL